jgi:excisionase family DNA binding protein
MYTVPEVMDRLSVSKTTLYSLLRRGDLPRVKVGSRTYVRATDLTTYQESLGAASAEKPGVIRHSPTCSYLVFHTRPCDCQAAQQSGPGSA